MNAKSNKPCTCKSASANNGGFMKKTTTHIALALAFALSGQFVYAENTTPPAPTESHEAHHPDGQPAPEKTDIGMMGSMNMGDMQGMMHQCMEAHKDGKMCDHQMMEQCQKNMGKGECQKMMKQAKIDEKKANKQKK
jgi:hypothetical protein